MSAKFTAGPWEAPTFNAAPYSIWKGDTQIASCRWVQRTTGKPADECVQSDSEARANATLIAAATDLFDAVDMLVKSFTAAGIAADCNSDDPAEVLMCKAMRAWLKAGAV